jgi:hypothetical protein
MTAYNNVEDDSHLYGDTNSDATPVPEIPQQSFKERLRGKTVLVIAIAFVLVLLALIIIPFIVAIVNSLPVPGCEPLSTVFTNATSNTYKLKLDLFGKISVYTDQGVYAAHMKHRSFSFPYSIDLMTTNDLSISVGKSSFFSLTNYLEVRAACSNNLLFTIRQDFRLGLAIFRVDGADGKQLITVEQEFTVGKKYEVYSSDTSPMGRKLVATISQVVLSIPTTYNLEILHKVPGLSTDAYLYLIAMFNYRKT